MNTWATGCRVIFTPPCAPKWSWNRPFLFGRLSVFVTSRLFSHRNYPTIHETNPFDILGIPKVSTYREVKHRFVELALQHHPDLNANGDSTEFLRFRQAFERIRESQDGTARLGSDGPEEGGASTRWSSDEEFLAWFHEETSHQDVMFRMDLATRKEVMDIAKSQSQGGLDRGGMWEMARAMAEQDQSLRKKKKDYQGTIGIPTNQPLAESDNEPAQSPRRRRRK